MEQIDWHTVQSLRSKRHPKEDLELRLGHSLFSKGGTMTANCALRFPEPITIDDDDDDVQIFSPRSFIEGRGMFSHSRSWAPVITEEDLELRLGFREYPKNKINIFEDGEDGGASVRQFDKKKGAAGSSSRSMDMKVNLTCAICMDTMKEETSTLCGHIFCHSCITSAINLQKKCPTCRRKLSTNNIHRIYLPGTS
ncbi:E3 ubiquitin-protein ligase CIP8-like [Nymphaea colorata]|nr:E3 ubiquitin-protein ligase CIP8-like [Nymphaea colorata]